MYIEVPISYTKIRDKEGYNFPHPGAPPADHYRPTCTSLSLSPTHRSGHDFAPHTTQTHSVHPTPPTTAARAHITIK